MSDDVQVWKWYAGYGIEPENFSVGPEDTRDAIIAAARIEFCGETFTIIEAWRGVFSPPSADDLMGEMTERWGDDDMGREDYPEFSGPLEAIKAAERDLDDLLRAWFERHRAIMPTPWCFADSRNTETFKVEEVEEPKTRYAEFYNRAGMLDDVTGPALRALPAEEYSAIVDEHHRRTDLLAIATERGVVMDYHDPRFEAA
jgi:hypothetical protein